MHLLAAITALLSAADHWTTYLCLRAPVDGWRVSEANPISEWLFQTLGLVPGLFLDSVVTLIAILFLVGTPRIPTAAKSTFFALAAAWTAYAVFNNVTAIRVLGIPLTGAS